MRVITKQKQGAGREMTGDVIRHWLTGDGM